MGMFCYQCEQTACGQGCVHNGVCGKSETTAQLQDLLIAWTKQIAQKAAAARAFNHISSPVDQFIVESLYMTLTNVSFSSARIARQIGLGNGMMQLAEYLSQEDEPVYQQSLEEEVLTSAVDFDENQQKELALQGTEYVLTLRQENLGQSVVGLQELILYGLKGCAAYLTHAERLDSNDDGHLNEVYGKLNAILAFLADEPTDVDALLGKAMEVGQLNLNIMELLEKGHIAHFGVPEPTPVRLDPVQGKCILVSGHDMKDLYDLLVQTENRGVNIYTHGEMLPAHSYPVFKKFKHLVGHYGGAWYQQQKEFDAFPGAILMTSNCLQKPGDAYRDYLFTTGPVSWDGIVSIQANRAGIKNFSPVIKAALDSPGFFRTKGNEKITVGFGADAVLSLSDALVTSKKNGSLRHFFLVGGCDGNSQQRNYFTELAEKIPSDCLILTLGCGKFRLNRMNLGTLQNGIPRLLDMGQCNDAWSAIRLAIGLSKLFRTAITHLPISYMLSWYEQKAVAVLLSLLSLGIQGIQIGPTLPAFLTPEVLEILGKKFKLRPVTDPDTDIKNALK